MAKVPQTSKPDPFSDTARALLREMRRDPNTIRYHTTVLGGMFGDEDVARLDFAYAELASAGLIEPAGVTIPFFGNPKRLHRITAKGLELPLEGAA